MKYPITPDYLSNAPDPLVSLYEELEDDVMRLICEQLKDTGEANATALERIRLLQKRGLSMAKIQKRIQQITGLSKNKVDSILKDAIQRNVAYYGNTAYKLNVQFTAERRAGLQAEISAISAQASGDVFNITQSLGFAVRKMDGTLAFQPIAEAYQNALNRAEVAVWSGGLDYNTAITRAVKELADSGIQTVDYATGYHSRADVAARRAVMTGITQISAKYSEALAKDIDTDFVEVTAHRGARDKGTGPENHKSWQGRVYHKGGEVKEGGVLYKDFEAVTGYGTGEGLCGWNCRHNFHPFVPGVMEPTYTEAELKSIDPPPITFEGREYTMYEATQKQRQIESGLRNIKRRMIAYDASGQKEAYTASAVKYRRLYDEYESFSKAADLPKQYDRGNAAGFGSAEHRQAMKAAK